MKKKARAHVIIKGRVQGVFFRMNTARAANRFGVCGWVKNRRDQNVEAVFEGEEDRIKAILKWCSTGDPPARVSSVDLEWEEFTREYNSFDITY
jgi:acylphosphatase